YTGHASGSLRGEPVVSAGEAGSGQGYLILCQAAGLTATQLRVFSLPIEDPNALPLSLPWQPHVPGWPSFPPYFDAEKLALIGDAGVLGLFGIRQQRDRDAPLFPLVREEGREPGIL